MTRMTEEQGVAALARAEKWKRQHADAMRPDVVAKPAKKRKYRNEPLVTPLGRFDSKKEFEDYQKLQLLERAGEIRNLRRQVPYAIVCEGVLICTYIADAVYEVGEQTVVTDSKGMKTREYLLKKRLMLACHKVTIEEL